MTSRSPISPVFEQIARVLVRHPKWLVAIALVYLVSPIDLVPEAFMGPIGYLDDIAVLLLPYLLKAYVKRADERRQSSVETTLDE